MPIPNFEHFFLALKTYSKITSYLVKFKKVGKNRREKREENWKKFKKNGQKRVFKGFDRKILAKNTIFHDF